MSEGSRLRFIWSGMRWVVFFASAAGVVRAVRNDLDNFLGSDKGWNTPKHVMYIGIDGFGGEYMRNASGEIPSLSELCKNGSVTFEMRDQMPSVSAPNWATILTGLDPVLSGIQDNDWAPDSRHTDPDLGQTGLPPVSGKGAIPESIFDMIRREQTQRTIRVAHNWDWIKFMCGENNCDDRFRGDDDAVAAKVSEWVGAIGEDERTFTFVHFDEVDGVGHSSYWGSDKYYEAVRGRDKNVQTIVTALSARGFLGDSLIVVTADHGGFGSGHGGFRLSDMNVPAVFVGPGVKKGFKFGEGGNIQRTNNRDLVPTILKLMGIARGRYMTGRVLEEIFVVGDGPENEMETHKEETEKEKQRAKSSPPFTSSSSIISESSGEEREELRVLRRAS
uniref:Metalloenzyme domain-containing protein n=1 Tax=Chromera velia CCMP2878 TaxID=1169474 RepID=A0A0G4HVJ9_9ALVE|eukprot:Cvel_8823.t1-p1 / transcript=Cvel_8823.t1 / gene=Cvel_8823 / organism=Chromera_velia_CCMP2878 / gene_product=hypothetical protein / transcript_product=hypothetical protein / location=Cvel_scaffold494:78863-82036(-) / protein_length=389 / sequence_SO=supercontig / SO=protein_coding / is_pseudo=false